MGWMLNGISLLFVLLAVFQCARPTEVVLDIVQNSIFDIVLEFNPNTVLNIDTPDHALVGEVQVISSNPDGVYRVTISPDDPHFTLDPETFELRLKKSGAILFKDVNSVLLAITATEISDPRISLTKYIRIPIEHNKEDAVIKIETASDLCDGDVDRRIFTIRIEDPASPKPYDCYISKSNYQNFNLVVNKVSARTLEVLLPPSTAPLFDYKKKPNLVVEVSCINDFQNMIIHKRTVDLKICHKVDKIKDIVLQLQPEHSPLVQFDARLNSVIARFRAIDPPHTDAENYDFTVNDNLYFKIVNNELVLKRKFDRSLLKYIKPKLTILVSVSDRLLDERGITRKFVLTLDDRNQVYPPMRFRAAEDMTDEQIVIQYAQSSEVLVKLGQVELNPNEFPPDRFDIRLNSGANVSLDDQGNLLMPIHPLRELNETNKDALITLNIFDKVLNTNVLEENFALPLPPVVEVPTTPAPNNQSTTPPNQSTNECTSDKDCNSKDGGPNACLKLSTLKDRTVQSPSDAENLIRRLEFLANKDQSIFLKYNLILQALASPTKDLYDTLAGNGINIKDLYEIGICLCDKDFTGFRCRTPVVNDKPHQCYPNSTSPSCNPNTSICQISEFYLRNNLQAPADRVNQYKSYYCECTRQGTIGVNCDVQRDQCTNADQMPPPQQRSMMMLYDLYRERGGSGRARRQADPPSVSDPLRRYPANFLGPVDRNGNKCDPNRQEVCVPLNNGSFYCKRPDDNTPPVVNFLVFDESNRNPKFADDPSKPDRFKRLNLSDASVVMGIQDFIKDEVMPRYAFDDYAKIPKGPLAIMRPSVNMPQTLNDVRNKVNALIAQNNSRAQDVLNKLQENRVQQLILDTVMFLVGKQKINTNSSFLANLSSVINRLVDRLNLSDMRNISSPLWDLLVEKFPANITNGDPTGLVRGLEALKNNSDLLNTPDRLREVLSLNASNAPYLDLFNFTNKPYNLLRLDILPGIYLDPDGELSLRPTPGVFLSSIPADNATTDRDLIFLPGIFNPVANPNCNVKSLFMPGIMSLPIDNYNLANLPEDPTKYLNKFVPMQLPFNLNGFLTPLRSSTSDTIENLLQLEINGRPLPNITAAQMRTHLLLTPLDLSPDSSFDIITKNEKFMTNLFTNESFLRVISEQKELNTQNLASTQVLSNPTMLPLAKQDAYNTQCLPVPNRPRFNPKGVQFFTPTNPADNMTVLPFIMYDDQGNPIPQDVVKAAIEKYCRQYQVHVNEFHARICDAMAESSMLNETRNKYADVCPNCTFSDYATAYYNYNTTAPDNNRPSRLPLLILAAILTALALAWLLAMLCLCCPCCPLAALLRRRHLKRASRYDPNAIKKNSSKIFGTVNLAHPTSKMNFISTSNGELVRSLANPNVPIFPVPDLSAKEPRLISTMSSPERVFTQVMPVSPRFTFTGPGFVPPTLGGARTLNTEELNLLYSLGPGAAASRNNVVISPSQIDLYPPGSTLQIKNPNRISSLISSSLVNEAAARGLPFAGGVENSQLFVGDVGDINQSFVARRLPNTASQHNRRWSVGDFEARPMPFETRQSGSSARSSMSYPNLNEPDLDLEQKSARVKERKNNVTTHIIEGPLPGQYERTVFDSNLVSASGFKSTDNLFQLKRLSHQINGPQVTSPTGADWPGKSSSYRKIDGNLDEDFSSQFYAANVPRGGAGQKLEPLVFKLHRIENNNPEQTVRSDLVTSINKPKPMETTVAMVQKQYLMPIRSAKVEPVSSLEPAAATAGEGAGNKNTEGIVIDWLLRKCDNTAESIEMKPVDRAAEADESAGQEQPKRVLNRSKDSSYQLPLPFNAAELNQSKVSTSSQPGRSKKYDELSKFWSKLPFSAAAKSKSNKVGATSGGQLDDEPSTATVRCCYCDKRFSDPNASQSAADRSLSRKQVSRKSSLHQVDSENSDDLLYICDSCYGMWHDEPTAKSGGASARKTKSFYFANPQFDAKLKPIGEFRKPPASTSDASSSSGSGSGSGNVVSAYYAVKGGKSKGSRRNSVGSVLDVVSVAENKKPRPKNPPPPPPRYLSVETPAGSNEIIKTNITTTTPSTTTSLADEDDWEASKSFKRSGAAANPSGTYRSSIRRQVNSSDFSSEDDHQQQKSGGLRPTGSPGEDSSHLNSASSFRSSMHALIKDNKIIPQERYSSKFKDQGADDEPEPAAVVGRASPRNAGLPSGLNLNSAHKSINWSKKYS